MIYGGNRTTTVNDYLLSLFSLKQFIITSITAFFSCCVLEQHSKSKQTEFEILQTEFEILQTESEILQTDFEILQTESKILQTDFEILHTDFEILQTESEILQTEFEILPQLFPRGSGCNKEPSLQIDSCRQ